MSHAMCRSSSASARPRLSRHFGMRRLAWSTAMTKAEVPSRRQAKTGGGSWGPRRRNVMMRCRAATMSARPSDRAQQFLKRFGAFFARLTAVQLPQSSPWSIVQTFRANTRTKERPDLGRVVYRCRDPAPVRKGEAISTAFRRMTGCDIVCELGDTLVVQLQGVAEHVLFQGRCISSQRRSPTDYRTSQTHRVSVRPDGDAGE